MDIVNFQRLSHRTCNNDVEVHYCDLRRPDLQIQAAHEADLIHRPAQQRTNHHTAGKEGVEVVELDGSLLGIERGNHWVTRRFDQTVTGTQAECTQEQDRKSTRLNSSHVASSYAVFCLKKKT